MISIKENMLLQKIENVCLLRVGEGGGRAMQYYVRCVSYWWPSTSFSVKLEYNISVVVII